MKLKIMTAVTLTVILLSSCFVPSGWAEMQTGTDPVKVILDTDFGYMNDDALALSMLMKLEESESAEILGITLSGGNNFINAGYTGSYGEVQSEVTYITDFLAETGRTDIPVYRGIEYPVGCSAEKEEEYVRDRMYYTDSDGNEQPRTILNNKYGAMWHMSDHKGPLTDSDDAADFMISMARKYAGELVLIVIGPACNVARAVEKDPDFAGNVAAVYMMGGAFGETVQEKDINGNTVCAIDGANTTNLDEYNVAYDPAALGALLSAGFGKVVITPGSCNEAVPTDLGETLRNALGSAGNPILQLWTEYHESCVQGYPYWDPMTVYALFCPEKITASLDGYVTVETDTKSEQYGMTSIISEEQYGVLSLTEQPGYCRATVVLTMDGFYDYLIPLLAG